MTIESFDDEQALAVTLAGRLVDRITATPTLVLGLPTGRTPIALYRELVKRTERDHVDWSGVRTFNLDEFVGLGGSDPGSYRSFMREELFDRVNINPGHIGMLDGRAADLEAECARYERAIAAAGGVDIQILGIGANGHIGFNEPAEHLRARTHVATLQEGTRAANASRFGGEIDRVPARALSMGMSTILSAKEIVLIATGASKAAAVAATIDGRISSAFPASFLQMHPHVSVMLDRAAGAALSSR